MIDKKKYSILIKCAIGFAGAAFLVPLLSAVFNSPILININLSSNILAFGEWFSNISTPLLSASAFLVLMAAFNAQREDLQLTKDELALTREELVLTREEFHQQNQTMSLQRFENTFFQMLTLHHQIVDSIHYSEKFNGRFYFCEACTSLTSKLVEVGDSVQYKLRLEVDNIMSSALNSNIIDANNLDNHKELCFTYQLFKHQYKQFYYSHQAYLGHYLKNLYQLIRFIDDSDIPCQNKSNYIDIVKAQLSSYECSILYFTAMSVTYRNMLMPLLVKYNLYEDMSIAKSMIYHYNSIYKNFDLLMSLENNYFVATTD